MRLGVLLFIVLVVVVLIAIGAITFQTGDGDATIHIDTDPIRESTERAVDEGREMIDRIGNDQSDDEQRDVEQRDIDEAPPQQPPATEEPAETSVDPEPATP